MIVNLIKTLTKRIFCKHEYKQLFKMSGNHKETGKEVIFYYIFECTKCGKQKKILMDKDYQIKGE